VSETQIENQLDRYKRLTDISRELASTLDLEKLLNNIVQAAADLSSSEAASILLYDDVKGVLYFDAATNLTEPLMRGLVVPVDSSLAGWIVTNRQPIIINDTQHDPRHYGVVGQVTQITTTSLLGVPLIAKDKVVGALEAINKRSGSFNKEDEDILMVLGAQAAVAIENARLFHQSDIISELVHELRTPLTSLNLAARLLSRSDVPQDVHKQAVDIIISESDRLSEMTTAFLDLARLESGRVQFHARVFDAAQLLQECINLMQAKAAEEKDIQICLELPSEAEGSLPLVKADRDKIKQVLLNLLNNAIKYNVNGGEIIVHASSTADEVIMAVSDNGLGIPDESIPHMFEKFYRVPGVERSVQGTGLGLYICKRIVDAHQGSIEVDSKIGGRTTFTLRLPVGQTV
jgi:signal transduction histidine kinase